MKWNWKQIIAALIFGLLLGTAIGRWSVFRMRAAFQSPEKRFERKLRYFNRKLKLDDGQRAAVKRIFEEKRNRVNALRDKVEPDFRRIRDTARDEIRSLLNDDQKRLFNKMEEKWKRKRGWRRAHFHFH